MHYNYCCTNPPVSAPHAHTYAATPGPNTPINRKQSFGQQRERLYRAGPGEYVAVQEVEAQQPGDIPLKRGMPVEGTRGRGYCCTRMIKL